MKKFWKVRKGMEWGRRMGGEVRAMINGGGKEKWNGTNRQKVWGVFFGFKYL